ncbi:MAG: YncE family protein [Thermoleophilia bacterium]
MRINLHTGAAYGADNTITRFLTILLLALTALLPAACTDESPDTSAPERIEIDRSDDWQGALLYIADGDGPVSGWGSIRIFDNVSGFVETSVEQTMAANPSDLYVVEDGSQMYVSSMANGTVDMFFWDGNGWRRGTREIDTPAPALFAIEAAPDGMLYLTGSSGDGSGALYRLDQATDNLAGDPIVIAGISAARGITWSADETTAFVTGDGPAGPSLLVLAWPGATTAATVPLPVATVNQPQISPDGLTLFIACRGEILTAEPATGRITGSLQPSDAPDTDYYDVAFSADGRFLFAPGTASGGDVTLYVVEVATGATVTQITHVGKKANGIKRVE